MNLVEHMARFSRALVAAGVRVAIGDEADGLAALMRVDLGEPAEVREALRCSLKIRRRDREAFDRLFELLWRGRDETRAGQQPMSEHGPGRRGLLVPGGGAEIEIPEDGEPGASPEAQLRRKPFERCDERDLAAMEPVIARLAEKLATRRSRRLRPAPRGRTDLRRSLRRSLGTGGELVRLAHRDRPVERPRLVFLCDTSGSMTGHTRFLLALARSLARVARGTEIFAFNTDLHRVTPLIASGALEPALARLAAAVPDWAGGTRIGESLAAFAARHSGELVDSRTVVIIFSDGLERGDPRLIERALRKIQARARRVIWLNPLLADPRYEPTARGMAAALPFIDRFAPVHDLETLERLIPDLGA